MPGAGSDTYSYVGLSEDAWQVSNGSAATGSLVAPDGSRLSVLSGSTLGWTIPDLHGSLVATTDSADALSSALRYDGYGQTQSSWTASGPLPSSRIDPYERCIGEAIRRIPLDCAAGTGTTFVVGVQGG